jgi:hypothetical protein
MSVFITVTVRTTARTRTVAKRKTRIGGDAPQPVRRETGDPVTGRRTSPDLPRNDDDMILYDDDDDDDDCFWQWA